MRSFERALKIQSTREFAKGNSPDGQRMLAFFAKVGSAQLNSTGPNALVETHGSEDPPSPWNEEMRRVTSCPN